ncbi:ABC transporter transmembrane domain-containing protein, partial [Methylobacterium hispanicum]
MRALEPKLFGYIWRYSRRDQLAICIVVLASLPFYFASLDLPRRIVNDAITGKAFERGNATAPFLGLTVHWPGWLGGGESRIFSGFEVGRTELLLGLSGLFLALVLINGAFKFWINLQKGVLGERMLRRLRFQLFSLMLRFTPETQGEVKASETATIIRDEVEPIGSFIGDAIVVPVFLGTQAATALAFILMQNVWLGLVAGGMVGVQMVVIPRLRREIIRLSRRRQLASRTFAGRAIEVLEGLETVTANAAGRWERAEIGGRLHGLYDLRLRIYRRKFAVKYLNNLLAQVTPFLFYAIGGLFALKGQLDIGQLVAVLAAYRDLPPPLKELIDWDQQRLDVEVKYETVAAHFAPHRLRPAEPSLEAEPPHLVGPLTTEGLSLRDPQGG